LDTGQDREKFSLGNWNSKVRNNIKIISPHNNLVDVVGRGKPIRMTFEPRGVIRSTIFRMSEEHPGEITSLIHPTFIPFDDSSNSNRRFWWQDWYSGEMTTGSLSGWPGLHDTFTDLNHHLRDDLKIGPDDGVGYIKKRTSSDISNNRIRIELDSNLTSKMNNIVNAFWEGPVEFFQRDYNPGPETWDDAKYFFHLLPVVNPEAPGSIPPRGLYQMRHISRYVGLSHETEDWGQRDNTWVAGSAGSGPPSDPNDTELPTENNTHGWLALWLASEFGPATEQSIHNDGDYSISKSTMKEKLAVHFLSLNREIGGYESPFTNEKYNRPQYNLFIMDAFNSDGGEIRVPIIGMNSVGELIVEARDDWWHPDVVTGTTSGSDSPHFPNTYYNMDGIGYPDFSPRTTLPNTPGSTPEPVDFKVACFTSTDYTDHGKYFEVLTDESKNISNSGHTDPWGLLDPSEVGYEWYCHPDKGEIERENINTIKMIVTTTTGNYLALVIPTSDLMDGYVYRVTGKASISSNTNKSLSVKAGRGGISSWGPTIDIFSQYVDYDIQDGNFDFYFTAETQNSKYYLRFYMGNTNAGDIYTFENITMSSGTEDVIGRDKVGGKLDSALFYYDKNDDNFIDTSYPIRVHLGIDVYGVNDFTNDRMSLSNYIQHRQHGYQNILFQKYELDADFETGIDETFSLNEPMRVDNNIFYYKVIQWGDEDVLLSDEDILDSEYFNLYEREEFPDIDDFHLKRNINEQRLYSKPIINGEIQELYSHIYSTPGVRSIKIIVFRYTGDAAFLIETILVTKNIVINDALSVSQDFEIFGGTDYNFLPLKGDEAIIGGLDDNSKYNISVDKVAKDSIYGRKDFLERKTNLDFLENFENGKFGKSPSKLDLSVTRMFKGTSDIYDFLMTENQKNQIVQNDFPTFSDDFYGEDDRIKIDSEATDIFINDGDSELKQNCMIEINPQKMEFLTIPNAVGNKDKGILIGDYKLKKEEGQPFQKEGAMQIPLLEENKQKQAF